jgi:DNA topoisomerase IA
VQRHREIAAFVPRRYFSLHAVVWGHVNGERRKLALEWSRKRVWVEEEAKKALLRCDPQGGGGLIGHVMSVESKNCTLQAPVGLNTVGLLTCASNSLGFSPAQTMMVAERLYMNGILSYPRTESTRYPQDRPKFSKALRIVALYRSEYTRSLTLQNVALVRTLLPPWRATLITLCGARMRRCCLMPGVVSSSRGPPIEATTRATTLPSPPRAQ